MPNYQSRFVMVGDIRTHYLECGEGPPLILLHAGGFGANGQNTWGFNIDELSKHFHIYAPDWVGYGKTDKLFSFDDMWSMRVDHIRRFVEVLQIGKAHFMGNSMGASVLITVAAQEPPAWDMDKIVVVSGGGVAPDNEVRQLLNNYDCSREQMRKIVETIYMRTELHTDEQFLDDLYLPSLEPGQWECTAAVRFKSPIAVAKGANRPRDYSTIKVPTMLVAGGRDNLRFPGYAQELQAQIPGCRLELFEEAGHCPHIDEPEAFNKIAIEFLTGS